MIVIMRPGAPKESIDAVIEAIEADGYKAKPIYGEERTIVGLVGESPNPHKRDKIQTSTHQHGTPRMEGWAFWSVA